MKHLLSQWLHQRGRALVLGIPWFWLLLFFAVPFFILLRMSVTDMGEGLDPFAPLVQTDAGHVSLHLKLANYVSLLLDAESGWGQTLYIESYALSLKYALWKKGFGRSRYWVRSLICTDAGRFRQFLENPLSFSC